MFGLERLKIVNFAVERGGGDGLQASTNTGQGKSVCVLLYFCTAVQQYSWTTVFIPLQYSYALFCSFAPTCVYLLILCTPANPVAVQYF